MKVLLNTLKVSFIKIIYLLTNKRNKDRDIWIISETENQFQDNGFAFFKYIRENYPQKEVYYIIDKKTRNIEELEKLGNILYFKSLKSIYYLFLAKKILSTHGIWMLPQEFGIFRKHSKKCIKAEKIMLQHGVTALKDVTAAYNKKSFFLNDKFIVNSETEKKILIKCLGYDNQNIIISGFPRYDRLEDLRNLEKYKILYMPTYRKGIKNSDDFLNSKFYLNTKSLLEKLSTNEKIEINFILHKEFKKYTKYYLNKNIKFYYDYSSINELVNSSNLLITDYSSICFDFLFLEKPIIFYLSDSISEKTFKEAPYINSFEIFKAFIFKEQEQVCSIINDFIKNPNLKKAEIEQIRKIFFKYKDRRNCERLFKILS